MFADFWNVVLKLFAGFVIGPFSIFTFSFLIAMLLPSGDNGRSGGDVNITINQGGEK